MISRYLFVAVNRLNSTVVLKGKILAYAPCSVSYEAMGDHKVGFFPDNFVDKIVQRSLCHIYEPRNDSWAKKKFESSPTTKTCGGLTSEGNADSLPAAGL